MQLALGVYLNPNGESMSVPNEAANAIFRGSGELPTSSYDLGDPRTIIVRANQLSHILDLESWEPTRSFQDALLRIQRHPLVSMVFF